MPTTLTHTFFGVALGGVLQIGRRPFSFWLLTGLCAALPDVDCLAFAFGVPYEHMLGHRGLTHSLAFAAVVAAVAMPIGRHILRAPAKALPWLGGYFFVVTALHGVLDAMTYGGGLGVAFFAPFSSARYYLPWRPLPVPPIGPGAILRTPYGRAVFLAEFAFVWVPMALLLLAVRLAGRNRQAARRR